MKKLNSFLRGGAALSLILTLGLGIPGEAHADIATSATLEAASQDVDAARIRVEEAQLALDEAIANEGDIAAAEAELADAQAVLAEAEQAEAAAAEEAAAEEAAAAEAAAEEAAAEEAAADEAAAEEAAAEEASAEEAAAEEASAEEAAAEEAAADEAAAEEAAAEEAAAEEAAAEEAAAEEAAADEAAADEAAAEEAAADEAAAAEAAAEEAAAEEAAAEEAAAEEAAADEAAAEEAAAEEAAADEAAAEEAAADEAAAEEAAAEEAAAEEAEARSAAIAAADTLEQEELEEAQRRSAEQAADEAIEAARAEDEAQSEEERQRERDQLIGILGSAAVGAAIGMIIPELGGRIVQRDDDRVVVQQGDSFVVRSDETGRLLTDGSTSSVEQLAQGRTRITVTRPDGTQIITLRDAVGNPLRRVRRLTNGDEIVLFDEVARSSQSDVDLDETLPWLAPEDRVSMALSRSSPQDIQRFLNATPTGSLDRAYSIREIRETDRLRWLAPSLELDAVTFDTNSHQLTKDQANSLDAMGHTLSDYIEDNPDEVFLIEGHTDAVGPDLYNLTLSDRRAESVASLLTSFYGVPAENLVTQGYGEQDLTIPTLGASRENRRVAVRRITPLLR